MVRPAGDGDLTAFFRWLTHTHAMRWRVAHRSVGYGHLYGGRFKSFPVQPGESFLKVCRYVERNPLTARAVESLDDYRWSSLWVRRHGTPDQKSLLSPWPAPRPANWLKRVNEPLTPRERTAWRTTLERSRPFGDDTWTLKTVVRLDLEHTIRAEGRPKQEKRSNETTAGTIN